MIWKKTMKLIPFDIITQSYMKIISSLIILFLSLHTYSQTNKAFPDLQKLNVDTLGTLCIFGYDPHSSVLINIPCDKLPKTDYWYCDPAENGEPITKLAKFWNDKLYDTLYILYTRGASDDPAFIIGKRNGKIIGEINCLEFYINNSGTIYTAGHTNNMFNRRQKFQLTNDTIIEIRQPYYYVGLKSKTTDPLTLYEGKTGNNIIAQLPKGYEVEILLCDQDNERLFLIRTEFGLIGWLRLKDDYAYETPIEGLFYKGD
jgi:hypothetical protein